MEELDHTDARVSLSGNVIQNWWLITNAHLPESNPGTRGLAGITMSLEQQDRRMFVPEK